MTKEEPSAVLNAFALNHHAVLRLLMLYNQIDKAITSVQGIPPSVFYVHNFPLRML